MDVVATIIWPLPLMEHFPAVFERKSLSYIIIHQYMMMTAPY